MDVAVVILNYNSSADTIKCIRFLRQQSIFIHIIVVDNASIEQITDFGLQITDNS